MASGKKNYFRHSMNARNDHKLRAFMDSFGRNWRDGYFYFFTLLELCGPDAQDGKEEHTVHLKTLRDLWGTNTQGVLDVCQKYAESALVMCRLCAEDAQGVYMLCAQDAHDVRRSCTTRVIFPLPTLLNYVGRYDSKAPNKEIKQKKEIKESAAPASPVLVSENLDDEKNLSEDQSQDFRNTEDSAQEVLTVESIHPLEEIPVSDLARNILTSLNAICFRAFRPTRSNMKFVNARINEGYELEDFTKVFKFKQAEWDGTEFAKYLQPSTLLSGKFDQYLQQANAAASPMSEAEADKIIAQYWPGA